MVFCLKVMKNLWPMRLFKSMWFDLFFKFPCWTNTYMLYVTCELQKRFTSTWEFNTSLSFELYGQTPNNFLHNFNLVTCSLYGTTFCAFCFIWFKRESSIGGCRKHGNRPYEKLTKYDYRWNMTYKSLVNLLYLGYMLTTKYMNHITFYLIFGNWYLPKSLHNFNLLIEKDGITLYGCSTFIMCSWQQMSGAHDVVCDVFASIPCKVGFHMKWEQLHALPSIIFNSFCWWVSILLSKKRICTSSDVVIANSNTYKLIHWSFSTWGFIV